MTTEMDLGAVNRAFLLVLAVLSLLCASVQADAASDRTKTVEFDVKPGGVVHSFSETLRDHECTFTYASQGGTNEQWMMSVGVSDDKGLFSCSVWRPQGKSYLFFTQFKAELKGIKVEYAYAYSQTRTATGQEDVLLKPEEFTIRDSTVTHTEGKFNAQLSKVVIIGRTQREDL